jgi:hypothetical protein
LHERLNLLSPTIIMSWRTKLSLKRMPWSRYRRRRRDRTTLLREMDRARSSVSSRRMRMVLPRHPHRAIGEWLRPSTSIREIISTVRPSNKSPRQRNFHPAFARQPGHYANECPNLRKNKPEQQNQNPGVAKGNCDIEAHDSSEARPA